MRFRWFGAVAVLTALAALLAGCRTNVGVAATVNGHRISESTVDGYVTQTGPTASASAQAAANNSALPTPKPFVVQLLVLENLFEHTLAANGGVPDDGALAAVHDAAAQAVLGSGSLGRAVEHDEGKTLGSIGIDPSFVPVLVRTSELEYILIKNRLKAASSGEFVAAIRKAGARVNVSPRYGEWDNTNLALKFTGRAGLPSFLKLQPTASVDQSVLPTP